MLCAVLFIITVYGWISMLDLATEVNAGVYCHEMVELYQQSQGDYGWPNCNHL
jgi:hypothetical protein